MYLIIDTETTGLPLKDTSTKEFYPPETIDAYNQARIVQIAWAVLDEHMCVKHTRDCIIKPKDFLIPPSNAAIHGITHEDAIATGIPLEEALKDLHKCINDFDISTIVAHNLNFDLSVILSELYRCENCAILSDLITTLKYRLIPFCTMQAARYMFPGGRYPKLSALYKFLTNGIEAENMHNAMADVEHCAACFVILATKHDALALPPSS